MRMGFAIYVVKRLVGIMAFLNSKEIIMKHLVFVLSFLFITLTACSSSEPNTEQAQPYEVINTDDVSFSGRKRLRLNIVSPNADTLQQLVHTAIKAAIEKQSETSADIVYIKLYSNADTALTMDYDHLYALVDYAPDGGGNSGDQGWYWQVEAVDSRQSKQLNNDVMRLLLDKGGFEPSVTNSAERLALIAKKLGISYEAANEGGMLKKYNVKQ